MNEYSLAKVQLFNIAADKGAEEINIIQALSHNGYLFFPLIYKHFSRIGIQFKKPCMTGTWYVSYLFWFMSKDTKIE